MAKLTFTKEELLEDFKKLYFRDIAPFRTLLSTWFYSERVNKLLDLDKYPSFDDMGKRHEKFHLETEFSTLYDYATTAILNYGLGDELYAYQYYAQEEILNLERMFERCDYAVWHRGTSLSDKACEIMEVIAARELMTPLDWHDNPPFNDENLDDPENTISRKVLAILAEVTEESVRQAHYAKGEDRLLPCENSNSCYSRAEVIRWLKVKGQFSPCRYAERDPFKFSPDAIFNSAMSFSSWIGKACHHNDINSDDLPRLLGIMDRKDDIEAFFNFHSERYGDENFYYYLPMQWLTGKVCIKLAQLLKVSPEWMLRTVHSIKKIQEEEALHAALKDLPEMVTPRVDVSDETAIDADLAKQELEYCDWVKSHPSQKKPNKKMDGYKCEKVTFTHQHDGKAQILWLPAEYKSKISTTCKIVDYPAADVNKEGKYNRHSGLRKYQELAEADLIKVILKDVGSFRNVLASLKHEA